MGRFLPRRNGKGCYEYEELLRRLFKGSKSEYVFSLVYITGILPMNFDGLRDDIVMALNDVPVMVNSLKFSNDMHKVGSKDDVLTLLCHLGYLSYNRDSKTAVIPNYEVRQEFETAVADTDWREVTDALKHMCMSFL